MLQKSDFCKKSDFSSFEIFTDFKYVQYKLEKTQLELEALGINYPTYQPIPEDLKNAL